MKVTVTAINPSSTPQHSKIDSERKISTFEVHILIGTEPYQFTIAVDLDKIDDREMQIVNTDRKFEEVFKFNLKLHKKISHLVLRIYNHQFVEFPIDLGEFEQSKMSTLVS